MIDKFSQALVLMREAFEDAQSGSTFLACLDLAAEVDGAQRVVNAAYAVQALRVAQYAGREVVQDGSGDWVEVDHGLGHVSEFAANCFGPMLAMGPVAADRTVDTAARLASNLPVTLAAVSAGDLDSWRATIIATELGDASAQTCAAVEAVIHPAVLGEAPGAVTTRVRRVLSRVDARSTGSAGPAGPAGPAGSAGPAGPAGSAGSAGPAGSAADSPDAGARVNVTGGLLDPLAETDDFGQPTPEPNPFTEPTWQQICAMGYEIPGIGVIGGDIVAAILDKFDTRITRVLLDERTGTVIETSTNTYLPSQAIRRFIQQRDGHCRFPGCNRNARRCEPDHVTPHSRGGPTTPWNLASLCKHHHRVKHQAGWSLVMTRDGTCTWTDPHRRQYTTAPTNHHELAA